MYKELWEKNINVSPGNLYSALLDATVASLRRAQTEQFVRIEYVSYLSSLLTSLELCDLSLAGDRFFKSNYAFPAPKGFPYLHMFDKRQVKSDRQSFCFQFSELIMEDVCMKERTLSFFRIAAIVESGLLQRWEKRYWPKNTGVCRKPTSAIGFHRSTVQHAMGAFLVLGCGLFTAWIVFLIEVCVSCTKTSASCVGCERHIKLERTDRG